jgi:lipoyl(octanoyl) transferase
VNLSAAQVLPRQELALPFIGGKAVEWRVRPGLLPYPEAVSLMEERVAAIADGLAPELVWLVEHPPL